MAGVRAAIDVQGLAGHECGRLEIQHRIDDLLDWFPGVTRKQIEAVLEHAEQSLAEA